MLYLLGKTLKHSYSKVIHNLLGSEYELKELAEDEFDEFISSRNFDGLNITIPYKQTIIKHIDVLSKDAEEIGAVNTVVNKKGKLYGYNTDYYGLKYLFKGRSIEGKKVLILGTGGTSKTAQKVVKDLKCREVYVVGRNSSINYENCYDIDEASVIINTTPLGMFPNINEKAVDLSRFKNLEFVVDVIYNPFKTMLLQQAKTLSVDCVGGLQMLVAQAYFSNCLFRGIDVDFEKGKKTIDLIYRKIFLKTCNIALVGMPSCGKSTIGKILAEKLELEFVDIDYEVEKVANKSIPQIFEDAGEDCFRELERKIIDEYKLEKGKVIATGGGAILREDNRTNISLNSLVIYIKRDLEKLVGEGRPLSKNKTAIKNLYEKRKNYYKSVADLIIENDDLQLTTNKILEYLL